MVHELRSREVSGYRTHSKVSNVFYKLKVVIPSSGESHEGDTSLVSKCYLMKRCYVLGSGVSSARSC